MQLQWKKPAARAMLAAIAQDVAEFFNISAPTVYIPDWHSGRDWEWRFDTVEVWTKAGRAELSVEISARFAHLYFKFDDVARAAEMMGKHCTRINRHSGKWNTIGTPDAWARDGKPSPSLSADMFRANLRRDFRQVAEPNPPEHEVAAYRAKQAERAAHWAAMRAAAE